MDKAGVAVAMLSMTTPAVNYTSGEAARKMARECNEYAAKMIADHPGRYGSFAMIPLADTEGSLKEIAYALDTLKVDGIGLMTSYHDKWLGDPAFLPVMEELNRRKVVVYTHPTAANCCVNLVRTEQPVMIEFGTDTTRTIADIVFSGNAQKFRDIRWIFSHAGGTMPFLIERFVRNPLLVPKAKATVPDGTLAELTRFYYDTAQTSNKAAMSALSAIIPTSQIVFGTDFPYRTSIDHVKGLQGLRRLHRCAAHGDRTRQRAEAAAAAWCLAPGAFGPASPTATALNPAGPPACVLPGGCRWRATVPCAARPSRAYDRCGRGQAPGSGRRRR